MEPTKNVIEDEEHTNPNPSTAGDDSTAAAGDDLISRLNDDVTVTILGLVGDAREVVRTGVLSRRWRGLWARVPVLHFDSGPEYRSPGDIERFIGAVNGVLALHAQPESGSMEQLEISLKVHYAPGEPRLAATTAEAAEGWIRYAVQHELTSFVFAVYVTPKEWLHKHDQKEDANDQ